MCNFLKMVYVFGTIRADGIFPQFFRMSSFRGRLCSCSRPVIRVYTKISSFVKAVEVAILEMLYVDKSCLLQPCKLSDCKLESARLVRDADADKCLHG